MIYDIHKTALNDVFNISKAAIQAAYDIDKNPVFSSGDEPVSTYYQVTYSLIHAISSTNVASIQEEQSFSVTISAESGYELSSVSVTHNGMIVAPTDNTYTYNIPSVSGDIIISAIATAIVPQGFSWGNVKWVPMGDSISDLTELYDGSESKPSTEKYQIYLHNLIPQMTVYNYSSNNTKRFANGGCGFWKGSNNFYTLANYVPSDATIITLFGSVNDWHYREMPNQIYTNPLSKVNSRSEISEDGKVTWIQNPHLDTVADKTLAGYVADTLRKLHRNAPNAKIVVNVPMMYAVVGGANNSYMLNAYFCYQAVVQAMLDEEDAGDWLSMETWYFDAKLTRSVDGSGNVIYTRATTDNFVNDTLQLDLWLEDNLNGTFDSRKIKTMPAFGNAYCYDYRTDGKGYGHFDNLYHQRYLAVKFAHTIINNLGGTENDLPQELKYNNIT